MTASEYLASKANDNAFQERKRQQQEAQRLAYEELQVESKALVSELKELGLDIESVADLVNSPNNYDKAIPVLSKHLDLEYSERLKEILIRALTVPAAEGIISSKLITMFRSTDNQNLKWVIGNALATVASPNDIGNILESLNDSAHGQARNMLVHALARLQNNEAIPLLIDYLNDPDLTAQAAITLGNLGSLKAKSALESVKHKDPWVMEQVKSALKKLTKP